MACVQSHFATAAGADPEGEIGETHDPEPHLIPVVLAAGRDGHSVRVFGNDYDTKDGTCVRDYIHVLDIADAHVRALNYLLDGGASCSLNLANARGHSVKGLLRPPNGYAASRFELRCLPAGPEILLSLSVPASVREHCLAGSRRDRI